MRLRSSGECLVIGFVLACCGPAWAHECPPSQEAILKLGEVGPVVNHMLKHDGSELAQSCLTEDAQEPAPKIASCLDSLNSELDRRYGHITRKIDKAMKKLTAITLQTDSDGYLVCPGLKKKKKATAEPINLPYHIAASKTATRTKAQAQSDDDDKMSESLQKRVPNAIKISLGRGTLDDYQQTVQRLACVSDEAAFANPQEAKKTLDKAKIGIDCAGAVQTTLQELTGKTNTQLGLGIDTDEDFNPKNLPKKFERSESPLSIRPGDIIPIDQKPVGHVVIAQEVRFELAKGDTLKTEGKLSFETKANDQLMKVKVASSWGNKVGPSTETWVYNMRSKKWAALDREGNYHFNVSGPYDHTYKGQYRPSDLPKE